MTPGREKMFKRETAVLSNISIPYGVRIQKWTRMIQAQESMATPIDPDDAKDAKEYLERLKQIKVPL